jgi:hypothetical protein
MYKQEPSDPMHGIDSNSLQKTFYLLLEQISIRDQKISWISAQRAAEVHALNAEAAERESVLRSTQDQLGNRELELHQILSSRTWKIALFLQRLRTFLVPLHSRREAILQRVVRVLFLPIRKIRKS